MRTCSRCKLEKSTDEFSKNKSRKNGLHHTCKICQRQLDKQIYQKFKDKIKERHRKNRTKLTAYIRNRKHEDIHFKLACSLRNRLWSAIKNDQKRGSAVKDLGCSISELKTYLESKFQKGMNWNNWTNDGWHIDHIKPLSKFDLSNREQFLEACNYTNLQPLWSTENLTKRNT